MQFNEFNRRTFFSHKHRHIVLALVFPFPSFSFSRLWERMFYFSISPIFNTKSPLKLCQCCFKNYHATEVTKWPPTCKPSDSVSQGWIPWLASLAMLPSGASIWWHFLGLLPQSSSFLRFITNLTFTPSFSFLCTLTSTLSATTCLLYSQLWLLSRTLLIVHPTSSPR